MARKKNKKFNIWFILAILIWIISGIALFITTMQRATNGVDSYFSNGGIIVANQISWAFFFAFTVAIVISAIKTKAKLKG